MTVRELIRRTPKEQVPTSTGPDEVTVRLSRRDFRRRRRADRRPRWRVVLALVLAAALVAGAGWAVFFSPYLVARGVAVSGAGAVGELRVQRAAQVPDGVPLARVDLDGVRQRVEAIPAVQSAEVSRSWPATVRVQVTPRTPVALVSAGASGSSGGEGTQALDAEGVRFAAPAQATRGLPRVEVADGVDAEGVTEGARVVAALPDDLARRVVAVRVGSVDEISLMLRGERTVTWGSAEQSATKAEVLAVLVGRLPREVSQIDVSVPGNPTTR